MTINRFNSADNFVMMSKEGLKDENLSWKAKGILAYMMSLPPDWQTHLSEVAKHSTDGIDSLRAGFKELEENGYVRRYQGEKEKGKFAKWVTDVSDVPIYKKTSNVEKTDTDKPRMEIPYTVEPTLLSNNNTNNNNTKNIIPLSNENGLSEIKQNMIKLFELWNKMQVTKHRKLLPIMEKNIKARLNQNYTFKQMQEAILNYSKVYKGDEYYFKTKYTFTDMLREKDIAQFMDESEPLIKFAIKKNNFSKQSSYQQPQVTKYEEFDANSLFTD